MKYLGDVRGSSLARGTRLTACKKPYSILVHAECILPSPSVSQNLPSSTPERTPHRYISSLSPAWPAYPDYGSSSSTFSKTTAASLVDQENHRIPSSPFPHHLYAIMADVIVHPQVDVRGVFDPPSRPLSPNR